MKATAAVLEQLNQPPGAERGRHPPTPGPTEVRVRLTATGGVCGSDLHVLDGTIPFATPSARRPRGCRDRGGHRRRGDQRRGGGTRSA